MSQHLKLKKKMSDALEYSSCRTKRNIGNTSMVCTSVVHHEGCANEVGQRSSAGQDTFSPQEVYTLILARVAKANVTSTPAEPAIKADSAAMTCPHLKEERQDHHEQQQSHYRKIASDKVVQDAVVDDKRRSRAGR